MPGPFFPRTRNSILSDPHLRQVWDERYDGMSYTLEVHVMELRKKLEAHGTRLFQTLTGRGYVFGIDRSQ